MGDSACVMHAVPYASQLSNEATQGNPMYALGDSISFGRFMSESLSWDKWSTFSHKRYVEEAASYAQPGSVAQKKAFFEAHYKRIAARKAAALAEQANVDNNTADPEVETDVCKEDSVSDISDTLVALHEMEVRNQDWKGVFSVHTDEHNSVAQPAAQEVYDVKKGNLVPKNEATVEVPFLKKSDSSNQDLSSVDSKKIPSLSDAKSSEAYHNNKPQKVLPPPPPARPNAPGDLKKQNFATPIIRKPTSNTMIETRLPQKTLYAILDLPFTKEPVKLPASSMQNRESSKVAPTSNMESTDYSTPTKTPLWATPKHASVTSGSGKKRDNRNTMSVDPSVSGSKITEPKWHILSAVSKTLKKLQSPILSTPSRLNNEERAARRKQKLEDKFNAKETEKVHVPGFCFCFRAQPPPDFFKQEETTKNQIHKQ